MQKLFFCLIASFVSLGSYAQLQLGVFGGLSNYQGDLVDKIYQSPKAAAGITVGYEISSRFNIRAGLTFAKVAGADSLNEKDYLRLRNLSFQSPITELSVVGEFNTLNMDIHRWSPYLFGGLAVFHFNPYTLDQNNNRVFLQPLGTEGQGLAGYEASRLYARTQIAVPFGGGIKYNISSNFRVALEVGMRKLFTDYLDDVSGNYADPNDLLAERGPLSVDLSYREDEMPGGDLNYPAKGDQRGSPKYKDYYYFTGLHLVYRLPEGRGGSRASKKSGYGCPTVF
ncbi:MAG: type IX secretion system protein PorG [Flavisolibacter sp.]